MGSTYTTKFSMGDKAYLVDEAKNFGKLINGPVEKIHVIDEPGGPFIYYRVIANSAIAPPHNLYREGELATEVEAKALAKTFHELKSSTHALRASSLS